MAQVTDYDVPNTTAANVRSEINDILGAVKTSNSSTNGSAPSSPTSGMLWYDGLTDKLKIYNGTAWQTVPYMPSGSITMWAGATGSPPTGWLTCKGQSLSTSTYADLFAAIAYTYGGSGSSFSLPDLQGRVPVGEGTGSGLSGRTLAATGGAQTHALTEAQMPRHTHNGKLYLHSAGTVSPITDSTLGSTIKHENQSTTTGTTTSYDLGGLTRQDYTGGTGSSQSASNGQAHNIMQPFLVMNYIIKI